MHRVLGMKMPTACYAMQQKKYIRSAVHVPECKHAGKAGGSVKQLEASGSAQFADIESFEKTKSIPAYTIK
jgi:hypothetical protein